MTRSVHCIFLLGAMTSLAAGCADPDPVGHARGTYPSVTGPTSPTTPPPPPPESFEESTAISLVKLGSSTVIKLGTGEQAAWSPDGSTIAFISNRTGSGNFEIYRIKPDGTDLVQLTNQSVEYGVLAWSPDGSRIAFLSNLRNSNGDLRLMNADGSHQITFVPGTSLGGRPASIAWSPDGQRMLFTAYGSGGSLIYVVNADGSNLRQLSGVEAGDSDPAWSPDGRSIAFVRQGGNATCSSPPCSALFVTNADGGELRQLTGGETEGVFGPAWSPDGRNITFASYHGWDGWMGPMEAALQLVKTDGTGRVQLLDAERWAGGASWSPDGRRLLVSTYGSGYDRALVSLPVSGGASETIVDRGWGGGWSPDGQWVLFTGPR